MSEKEHTLLCVMAESAAGKDRLVYELCRRNNLSQVISYTTRPKRNNEGETHVFVNDDVYKQMKDNKMIAAYTNINHYHYWSTIDQLYESDVYIIDPVGVESLKAMNLSNLKIVTVYINVPEEIRKERSMRRGDSVDVYRSRTLSERQQFRDMKKNMNVDYVIPNINFPNAYSILKWIATVEGIFKNHVEDNTK